MSVLRKIGVFTLIATSYVASATVVMKPTAFDDAVYDGKMLEGDYLPALTKPEKILGFPVGQRTATPAQITEAIKTWSEQSDRVVKFEYARTYENRPLHYLAISSPKNIERLDAIKADIAQLAEPTSLNEAKVSALIDGLPATAWMAYSIHGNESSGSDSALAVIYHLLATQDKNVLSMLDNMVVFIDPMMNPDGRARFTKQLEQDRGAAPNVDNQSNLHNGTWPFGRTNHYYFDLNRDFYFAVNPESKGRIRAINEWFPQLMIDAHEMGSLDNFLMGPPREPINPHVPASTRAWGEVFAKDQAADFDKKNWPFYTGEWFENLYPGYSNYSEYRGSVHILYEQARTAEDGVRTANGNVRTYKESVHHQFVSTMSNLATLQENRAALYRDFVASRKQAVSAKGPYASRSFVILPTDNQSRVARLVDLLTLQNIDVFVADKDIKVKKAKNHLGQMQASTIPKGSLVIPNRQVEGRLLAAIMEFETEIKDEVLLEERQKTLRSGESVMYDTTAWNLSMMFGLAALEVPEHIATGISPYQAAVNQNDVKDMAAAIAFSVNGMDDNSVSFAARLMEQGVKVRVLDKDGVLNGQPLPRGSVVVNKYDNPNVAMYLPALVANTANELNIAVNSVSEGLGEGRLPDIGSEHFQLLTRPQIALLSYDMVNSYDMGAIWHLLDTRLGIRHSHLQQSQIARVDLRRYNTLIVPSQWGYRFSDAQKAKLDTWVKQGGTLIAIDSGAQQMMGEKGLSAVKELEHTLTDAGDYDLMLQREFLAKQDYIVNADSINSYTVPTNLSYPWSKERNLESMNTDELTQWFEWNSNFMPSGAFLATRTDQKHWLTYGVDETLPVLFSDQPLLMADEGTNAVIRFGSLVEKKGSQAIKVGWATVPEDHELRVRMSGLVWPEAAQQVANAAYLTQERKGNGQIILFAGQPNFRGASHGTSRLLLNAIVYGAGVGASAPINP